MEFNENLKEARKKLGLTQQDIADRLGIDKSTYSGYETGKREPDVKKIKALSALLCVTPDFLLGIQTTNINKTTILATDTQEVAAAYENADFDTKNNIRFILKLPVLEDEKGLKKNLKTS